MTHAQPFDVVIADDDTNVLDALRGLLDDHPGLRVVGWADSGHRAAELCARLRPHLALLDVSMATGGVAGAEAVGAASPETKVAFYTAQSDRRTTARLHAAGALGVFAKGAAIDLAGELYELLCRSLPAVDGPFAER